jgi:two-component system response regulator
MKKMSILIAEDDADDRFLLKKAFEEHSTGENIHFVENGIEVMDHLKKIKLNNQSYPSLILLDLNMPRKDGREVLKEIKENETYKKIPVIVFTTSGNEMVIDKCYELGANTYIIKPLSFEKLLEVVQRIKSYWMQTASYPL